MKDRVTQAIFRAIDEINLQLPKERRLAKSLDTVLSESSESLDSLRLVNLIVTTEENIEEEFGLTVNIADQRAMSQEKSPFQSVRSLADYVSTLLQEKSDGATNL